jgi:tRNA(Ile)-lysidine synthase TilS/MesJ
MLVLGNLADVSEEMAMNLAHATFGFHPTNVLAVTDIPLSQIFRPLLFTEKKDWVNFDSKNGRIGYLFKEAPSEDVLVKLGALFQDIFPGCVIELQEGNYQE